MTRPSTITKPWMILKKVMGCSHKYLKVPLVCPTRWQLRRSYLSGFDSEADCTPMAGPLWSESPRQAIKASVTDLASLWVDTIPRLEPGRPVSIYLAFKRYFGTSVRLLSQAVQID